MQQGKLKLKEIIWEVTSKCNNNCSYCGSKEVNQGEIDNEKIMEIAKEIAKFPPEQIDISGGDPLLLSFDTHKEIVKILKEKNIIVKILFNPKSLKKQTLFHNILNLYDWIGLSINDLNDLKIIEEELYLFKGLLDEKIDWRNKYTVITNFNLTNIFLYEKIGEFVKNNNLNWMIQYTVYKDRENQLAIYNNDEALEQLKKKVIKSIKEGIKVIISDNANTSPCGAGTSSIGILDDGTIVPCLSMRAWASVEEYQKLEEERYNILDRSLKDIWETEFEQQRFGCFECCKDACKNKILFDCIITEYKPESKPNIIEEDIWKIVEDKKEEWERTGRTIIYGVIPGSSPVMMYGVFPKDNIVQMYAVFFEGDLSTNGISTSISTNITDDEPPTIINPDPPKSEEDDLPF